jgi:hypothetical protein
MSRYLLSIFQPAETHPDPAALETIMAEVGALVRELETSEALVLNAGLMPASTAKVVRPEDEEFLVTDGAFVETKEHLGGFIVVAADDQAAAIEWGRKLSRATTLPIEVRGLAEHGQG